MAKENTEATGGTSAIEKGLGIIERAWEAQWSLRLICVVLYFDMATILHAGRGLLQWSVRDNALLGDVGWLAVAIVLFSFTVAMVIPVVLAILRQIGWIILRWLRSFPSATDNRPYQRPVGKVFACDLRKLALQDKDEFLFRLYEAHNQQRAAYLQDRAQIGELTAAALLVALADWVLAQSTLGSVGLIDGIMQRLDGWAPVVVIGTLLCAATILKWAWFSDDPPDLIYYPPLDNALRAKEREDENLT